MADDHALAEAAALRAGALLIQLRAAGGLHGAALGRAGDQQANQAILHLLRSQRQGDAVLSEESAPNASRLGRSRVWIVDPLDGTREFCEEASRNDWAVHVALCIDGVPSACAVALPALGELWRTGRVAAPPVVRPGPSTERLKIVVSRTRPPAIAQRLARELGAELIPMGSAGAKAMAVVRGDAQVYLHAGGMNEWDSCAPVGVALAHGLHASRLDGSACRYNQLDSAMPDLLICRSELAPQVLELLARA